MFKDRDDGVIIIVLVLVIEAALMFFPHATVADGLLGRIMGTMDAIAMLIAGYKWGSSQGSKDKTELLAQSSALPPPQVRLSQP